MLKLFVAAFAAIVLSACGQHTGEKAEVHNVYGSPGVWSEVTDNHFKVAVTIEAKLGRPAQFYQIEVIAEDDPTVLVRKYCGAQGDSPEKIEFFRLKSATSLEYHCGQTFTAGIPMRNLKRVDELLTLADRPPIEVRDIVANIDHYYDTGKYANNS